MFVYNRNAVMQCGLRESVDLEPPAPCSKGWLWTAGELR